MLQLNSHEVLPGDIAGRSGSSTAPVPRRAAAHSTLHAVVLAGTHPWGRCPLDAAIARPLLPVANRPLIRYAIDWLEEARVRTVAICANTHTPEVQQVLCGAADGEVELSFYDDPMPRGPAGCVRDAARCGERRVIVVDGTIVPQTPFLAMLASHEASAAAMTLVAVCEADGGATGPAISPAGIYVMNPEVLEYIPDHGYQDIKETLIPRLVDAGLRVQVFVADAQSRRVQDPAGYMAVNDWAVCEKVQSLPGSFGYARSGDACVHESACLDPTARCLGPVLIGPHARIGRDVTVVGPTSIGIGCSVEDGAVVSRSAVWNHAHVGANAVIDRCVVTHGQRVSAGADARMTVLLPKSQGRTAPESSAAHWPVRERMPAPRRGRNRPRAASTRHEPMLVR